MRSCVVGVSREGGSGDEGGLCVLLAVANARAGDFHVYSCRMPNGEVAPTDGWSGSATGAFVYAEDKCAKGGALLPGLGDGVEHEAHRCRNMDVKSPAEETSIGASSVARWRC